MMDGFRHVTELQEMFFGDDCHLFVFIFWTWTDENIDVCALVAPSASSSLPLCLTW